MKILITGSSGQLGQSIKKVISEDISQEKNDFIFVDKNKMDICNNETCKNIITNIKPDWLINAAAYTNVEMAEANQKIAYEVNYLAVKNLAKAIKSIGSKMLHISTDYVFSGQTHEPYKPNDIKSPINIYGNSKARGEEALINILGDKGVIIRTSWLYSQFGKNFLKTILNLIKNSYQKNSNIKVVSDQIGCPTQAINLAKLCLKIVSSNISKSPSILHWSDSGVASWYDFASAIYEIGLEKRLFENNLKIIPVSHNEYKTLARRPSFSVLNTKQTHQIFNLEYSHWRENLFNEIQTFNF